MSKFKSKRKKQVWAGLSRALDRSIYLEQKDAQTYPIELPILPVNVRPTSIAMDSASSMMGDYFALSSYALNMGFIGYPRLAELSQISEYRSVAETTANEMVREWIELKSNADGDKSEKIKVIMDELERHKVREHIRKAIELEHLFGRAQIYINVNDAQGATRKGKLVLKPETVAKGSLKGFKVIEPIWTSPNSYNANDPARDDFFLPNSWFVLGQETHASRLLTLVMRPVPDMLKPAYNFGGMSMSQLMMPYVERFHRTSEAVSELIHSFSLSGIATDMSNILQAGSVDDIVARAKLYNKVRDNRGLMMIDKGTEEFFQFNTPLSGMDALQAQAQEQQAAPSHTPLVKLLGITPTGLNANSEGEIAVYYDHIRGLQQAHLREPLDVIIQIIQLDKFGEIDPDITFDFVQLKQLDGADLANVRKTAADTAQIYVQMGSIDAEEVRQSLATDPNSGYEGLDLTKEIEVPDNPEELDNEETNIPDRQGHNAQADNGERGSTDKVSEAT